ncbi:hypothetical protein A0H81_11922 [Grifola frondosa]|uniref:DUF8191 domain-containing protein n=1 Tax=Grifola frondosa TaxID=5627 RepID=A0A1C7LTS2_GRIFR|nr:hypothetical protein A0H81_11922 [Grifola frondosa]
MPYGSQYDAWREDEYRELLARGATPLMCDTFHLEFKHSIGIVAWADGDLYDSFAGPRMQKGDFWKIRLGRRIELEADDLDGSQFIEALLEEIFYYPVETAYVYWETVEESPGIWVTRLTEAGAAEVVNGDAPDEMTLTSAWSCDGLEAEEPSDLLSVIHPNDYEPSDAGSESELVEDQHPSWYIDHRGHDSTFDSEDDMDEDFEPGGDISVEGSIAEERIYDSADSDFDDDEILSGDEVVLDAYYRRA